MKKIAISTGLVLVAMFAFGQAKKPTIMVVPSDQYCISRGYKMEFNNQGLKQVLPDYKVALQSDPDLRLVITKMGQIMANRGFPLKDLEQEMKTLANEAAESSMLTSSRSGSEITESPIDVLKRVAKADIIMDLDFEVKREGPRKYIVFNLKGLDAYTSKQVSGVAGAGAPSSAASPELLLEEAVLSHMDGFNAGLMAHFEDMFAKGREVKVLVKTFANWGSTLEDEFGSDNAELSSIIEEWFVNNAVEGRFNLSDATHNQMRFEQVRIPMTIAGDKGKVRAVDTRYFVNELRKHLKGLNIESKLYLRGLGEAWLIVGEK